MNRPRQFFSAFLAIAILCCPIAAQTPTGAQSQTNARVQTDEQPSVAPAVTASATDAGVRFAAAGEVLQVRLQIYAAAGELVFDSGARAGGVIDWKAADVRQGLGDGAYLCVVTVKDLNNRQTQKLAALAVESGKVSLAGAREDELTAAQLKSVAAARRDLKVDVAEVASALTVMREGKERAVTVASHDGRVGEVTSTTGGLSFRTGDFFAGTETERMRITPDGRVGIGTGDPQATLDVAGTVRARGGIVFDDGTVLKSAQGTSRVMASVVGGDTPTPNVAGTGTTNQLAKWNDNAGTLGSSTITEVGGNVGIGTTSPASLLHLAGPAGVNGITLNTPGNQKFRFQTVAGVPNWGAFTLNSIYNSGWSLDDTASNGWFFKLDTRGGNGAIDSNGLWLWRIPQGPNPHADEVPVFGVTNGQAYFRDSVAIGLDTPTQKLDVAGNVKITGAGNGLIFPDGTKQTTAAAGGGGSMTGTSIVSAINDAATAGVIGDNRLSANVARLNGANAWSSNQSITGNLSATGGVTSSTLTVDTNTLSVNAATHRVGIGTTSPEQALSVNGSLSIDQANLNPGTLTTSGLTFGSQSGEGIASKRTAGSNQFGIDFYTNFVNRMTITNTGRVGIGTTAPAAKLDILSGGNNNAAGDLFAMSFQWNGGGYRHWLRTRHNSALGSGNAIDFFVNNSVGNAGSSAPGVGSLHVMTLDSGRVGVGTQSPAFKLHVSDTGNTGLRVENATAGGTVASFGGSGDFAIDAVGVPGGRMIVKENGNVGVGTNNPGSKLSVVGDANVNGNITAAGTVAGNSIFATNVVTATGFRFGDGTMQTSAAGTTFTSYRNGYLQLPQVGQSAASIEHLDLPAGYYEITATFVLENDANIAFQDNTRQIGCTLVDDPNTLTMAAPSSGVFSYNTVTLHAVKTFAQPTGIDLSCKANTGGTDRSYVWVIQRRLTALKLGDNLFVQP